MLNHRNNYLLCLNHARGINRTEGKVFIAMNHFGNGESFCCGKCAKENVENPAEVLVLLEDTMETQIGFLNQFLHLDLKGVAFDDFAPLNDL